MRRSAMALAASIVVGIGSLFGGSIVHTEASKLSNLENEKTQIQKNRSEVDANISESDEKIKKLQSEQQKVNAEIKKLDLAISDTNKKIREKTQDINETQKEIKKLQGEIKVLEERIAKRNELLKDRARTFQENGGMVSYMDVLMGATSFSDFVDRATAVATIMEADKDILEQHKADIEELEQKKQKVESDLAKLQQMLADLETMNKQLSSQRAAKDKLMKELVKQEEEEHDHKMELQEKNKILKAQEAAMAKAIQLEKERIAKEAERARREAAARAAAARAAAAKKASSGGGSHESSAQAEAPPVTSGNFMKPTNGVYTSGFGSRWGTFHYGVDWANRASNVPVVAAASGVVIKSYYSPSYGNVVFVAHYIDGQTYTTVYAHLDMRAVGDGAVVSKGQFLGYMGNTGHSTGKHLHFELHKGEWNDSKSNAVNPFAYGVPR
ncbi:peptidoglycan DD-metalloendopeptidase family protein [Neobacillus sp. YIM B06451]|uniref:murein hydrolase activator EnvC family protein n=1 Tax=Neobacillus sp. YIM B06451 TaxID=3070994 RepID=UPI00292F3C24|nr:peptidoglycan DD-metalloendopeptidase family protein [Neobacillus sp. YIM B06451]